MTAEQAYDVLCSAGYAEPAALKLGGRYILGEWLPVSQLAKGGILRSKERAIRVFGEGSSWDDALTAWRTQEQAKRQEEAVTT